MDRIISILNDRRLIAVVTGLFIIGLVTRFRSR